MFTVKRADQHDDNDGGIYYVDHDYCRNQQPHS